MANQHRLVFGKHFPVVPIRQSLGLQPETVQVGTLGTLPLFASSISSLPADVSTNRWVIYFHGADDNNTDMWDQTDFHHLRDMGFHILAPEYSGYSGKPGQATEQAVEQQAHISYDYLRKTHMCQNLILSFSGPLWEPGWPSTWQVASAPVHLF